MILLDTNMVSEVYKPAPYPPVVNWLDSQSSDSLYLCAPVLAELRLGMERLDNGRRKEWLRTAIERLENELYVGRILAFDVNCVAVYGRFVADRLRSGRPIQQMDAFIAAIAAANGAALATRNVTHFDGFGLELINPFDDAAGR